MISEGKTSTTNSTLSRWSKIHLDTIYSIFKNINLYKNA